MIFGLSMFLTTAVFARSRMTEIWQIPLNEHQAVGSTSTFWITPISSVHSGSFLILTNKDMGIRLSCFKCVWHGSWFQF